MAISPLSPVFGLDSSFTIHNSPLNARRNSPAIRRYVRADLSECVLDGAEFGLHAGS